MLFLSQCYAPSPIASCMVTTLYVFSFRVVFFYLVTTDWIMTSAYDVRIQSNQLINTTGQYLPRRTSHNVPYTPICIIIVLGVVHVVFHLFSVRSLRF